jgi:CHAD domain-containing protein
MAFQLQQDESVRRGIRRLARKQIDKAGEALASKTTEDVHDARKRFKRVRSVVRLVRDEIGEREYDRENVRFRDAGRPLSQVRDARALILALDALAQRFADETPTRTWDALRQALEQRQRDVSREVIHQGDAIGGILAALDDARRRVKKWPIGRGFPTLASGLKRTHKRGRLAHVAAVADPTTENLHEWRKRVKDLWYHLEVLEPTRPDVLDVLAEKAHRLADLLGDDHDLAVLRSMFEEGTVSAGDDATTILTLIDRRRAELQQHAVPLGDELYRDRPKDFVARLGSYWREWRQGAKVASSSAQG